MINYPQLCYNKNVKSVYEGDNSMEELKLNLMETYPDETWAVLYEDIISGQGSIDSNSAIAQYINLLNENNISYVSHFSDNMTGGKHPKYTNKFRIFVKIEDLQYTQDYLVEKGLLLDKTIEEIEEFKDVDMNEEFTYQSLSSFNKTLHIIFSISGFVFLWGFTILLIYLSTQVSGGKVGAIIITILFCLFSIIYTKRIFSRK